MTKNHIRTCRYSYIIFQPPKKCFGCATLFGVIRELIQQLDEGIYLNLAFCSSRYLNWCKSIYLHLPLCNFYLSKAIQNWEIRLNGSIKIQLWGLLVKGKQLYIFPIKNNKSSKILILWIYNYIDIWFI